MLTSEQNARSVQERKEKIRKRYEGIDPSRIKTIPAKPVKGLYEETELIRVGVYARVSTDDPNQTSSYELQKTYYEDMVNRNSNWVLVDIYADEGISGTSLNHRDEFQRLIQDFLAGKIDLIITKSVSRFARNIEDCIHDVRQLTNKRPPTGILFEAEGIYTLNDNVEMSLAMNATMAQEESHIKSVGMNRSIEMRFYKGIFLTPVLLGYDHDEDGNLVINTEEAKTARLIFLMYLCGYSCMEIAGEMTRLKRVTKLGNEVWSEGSIHGILRNERYCGDVLARKTFTPNYLDHKSIKNNNDRPQYYVEDHHEAIVSRDMFLKVQSRMDQAKYGFRNGTPELKVVEEGILRGFVQINPCWMGFSDEDYLNACQSVLNDADYLNPVVKIKKEKGDYDFSDYCVTRGQFVPTTRKISVSLSLFDIKFSSDAINAMPCVQYVELLFHPLHNLFVVRAGTKGDRHSLKWSEFAKERFRPRRLRGKAFMPIIYELMGWNQSYRYTLTGIEKEQGDDRILLFYGDEPEIRIYEDGRMKTSYKKEWADSVGDPYFEQMAKAQAIFDPELDWQLKAGCKVVNDPLCTTKPDFLLINEMEGLKRELERQIYGQSNEI